MISVLTSTDCNPNSKPLVCYLVLCSLFVTPSCSHALGEFWKLVRTWSERASELIWPGYDFICSSRRLRHNIFPLPKFQDLIEQKDSGGKTKVFFCSGGSGGRKISSQTFRLQIFANTKMWNGAPTQFRFLSLYPTANGLINTCMAVGNGRIRSLFNCRLYLVWYQRLQLIMNKGLL